MEDTFNIVLENNDFPPLSPEQYTYIQNHPHTGSVLLGSMGVMFSDNQRRFTLWLIDYLRQNNTWGLSDFEGSMKIVAFSQFGQGYLMGSSDPALWRQFENWFLGTSEGKDGEDYDASYWDDPNLTFPAQNLPSWQNYYDSFPHYPNGSGMSATDVYKMVGGEIYQRHISPNPNIRKFYQNACALRVSRALLYSGINIPAVPGTMKGEDGKNYFLAARALNLWMRKTFGVSPSNSKHRHFTKSQGGVNGQDFPSLLSGINGIFSMVSPKNSTWASGHADCLQSNGTCVNNCHFYDGDIEYIDVWELN